MTQTVNLALAGITCASCVKHITEALLGVPGVTQAEVYVVSPFGTISTTI